MSWHVKLGGQITVARDQSPLGPAPNKSVAVLLIGLLARGQNWSPREELARLLYPGSDPTARRTALRQTIRRMRLWLGESWAQEEQDHVRLAGGQWSYDLALPTGEPAIALLIAPGLQHPWIDALRLEWSPATQEKGPDGVADFSSAVQAIAALDVDAARQLLAGGAAFLSCISVDLLAALIGLTRPKDRRDPCAFEHLEVTELLHFRLGNLHESRATAHRAYRLATQQGHSRNIMKAGALELFRDIEDGQLGQAAVGIERLRSHRLASERSLLFCNARACYLWNMNRLDEAVAEMSQGMRRIQHADRSARCHFWVNLSVLSAEAGVLGLSEEASAEARGLVIPALEIIPMTSLSLAEGHRLMLSGYPDEAVRILDEARSRAAIQGHEITGWYAAESMSEALALSGLPARALKLWESVESRRRTQCTRPTPRLLARRARILKLA